LRLVHANQATTIKQRAAMRFAAPGSARGSLTITVGVVPRSATPWRSQGLKETAGEGRVIVEVAPLGLALVGLFHFLLHRREGRFVKLYQILAELGERRLVGVHHVAAVIVVGREVLSHFRDEI
jgi:hypothetical protein